MKEAIEIQNGDSTRRIRRLSTYIILVMAALMVANFVYMLNAERAKERVLIYQEAKAVSGLFESMQTYVSRKQDLINTGPGGVRHFKGLNPERVSREISAIFNHSSDHRLKLTTIKPRHPANAPDATERTALLKMQADPSLVEFFELDEQGGGAVYYFIKRLSIRKECLQCHGGTAGETDIAGYPKEGMREGDFGGAISVQIPTRALSRVTRSSLQVSILFTLLIAAIALFLVSFFLRRISRLSRELTFSNASLASRNVRLASLEQLKNNLFHMLVHDLKSPLTFMTGSLQMLQEKSSGPLNTEQEEMVGLVLRGCNRLESMIIDILDVNRLEEGKFELKPRPVRIDLLLSEKERLWREHARRQQKTLLVRNTLADPEIGCDPGLLERILENLVSNAFKHTSAQEGEISVEAEARPGEAAVLFKVVDNGEGVPPEEQQKIFEKYTLAEGQAHHQKSDTGLGLTFCRMAVEAMGGRIWLESQPGHGSTFYFTLPRRPLSSHSKMSVDR